MTIRRRLMPLLVAAAVALTGLAAPAGAATPAEAWTALGRSWALFSDDGALVRTLTGADVTTFDFGQDVFPGDVSPSPALQ